VEIALIKEIQSLIHEIEVAISTDVGWIPNRSFSKERIEFDLHRILKRIKELIGSGSSEDHIAKSAYELASVLFCMGVDSLLFRRLLALVAKRFRRNENSDFLPLAILAGLPTHSSDEEWMRSAIQSNRFQFVALLSLAQREDLMSLKPVVSDIWEQELKVATFSILRGDFVAATDSIISVSRYWMEEDEEWEKYEPGYYPQFEPYICAFAFKFQELGGSMSGWPLDVRRFLCPALWGMG
jgi:hypothetical protein